MVGRCVGVRSKLPPPAETHIIGIVTGIVKSCRALKLRRRSRPTPKGRSWHFFPARRRIHAVLSRCCRLNKHEVGMSTKALDRPVEAARFVEDVAVRGHIIDSLILPKILDLITSSGGSFHIKRIAIGQGRNDPSYALVEVQAGSEELLN